jgi:hypothetical protein
VSTRVLGISHAADRPWLTSSFVNQHPTTSHIGLQWDDLLQRHPFLKNLPIHDTLTTTCSKPWAGRRSHTDLSKYELEPQIETFYQARWPNLHVDWVASRALGSLKELVLAGWSTGPILKVVVRLGVGLGWLG